MRVWAPEESLFRSPRFLIAISALLPLSVQAGLTETVRVPGSACDNREQQCSRRYGLHTERWFTCMNQPRAQYDVKALRVMLDNHHLKCGLVGTGPAQPCARTTMTMWRGSTDAMNTLMVMTTDDPYGGNGVRARWNRYGSAVCPNGYDYIARRKACFPR